MWRKAFRRTSSLYKQVFPEIIMFVISAIASFVLSAFDPLSIGKFGLDENILYVAYIIVSFISLYPFVLFFNLILDNYEIGKTKDLQELSRCYTKGKELLDYIIIHYYSANNKELQRIAFKIQDWKEDTLSHYVVSNF